MTEPQSDLLLALRERIDVRPAPVDDVLRRGRSRQLRRRTAALVAAAGLVAGSATGALLLRGGDDRVAPAKSVLGHAWWADGTLHLGAQTVAMPGVQHLVEIPGGVVVGNAEGEVIEVRGDGGREEIGHQKWAAEPDASGDLLLVDDSTGLLAWIDGDVGRQEVVVFDPVKDTELARHGIHTVWDDPVMLRAFDEGTVYYDQRDGGDHAWRVAEDHVDRLGTGASYVMDAENGLWLTMGRGGRRYTLVDRDETIWTVDAIGGNWQFSPDAAWLLNRWSHDSPFLVLRDAATGERIPTGLPADAVVVASYPGDGGQITYAVGESREGPFDLVRCDAASGDCTTLIEKAADHLPVVLPEDPP
jgi:hypothetical protein